jgi:hypothetical protein
VTQTRRAPRGTKHKFAARGWGTPTGRLLDKKMDAAEALYGSLPLPHAETHRPVTGSDPLAVGAPLVPISFGQSAAAGSSDLLLGSGVIFDTSLLQAQVVALIATAVGDEHFRADFLARLHGA